MPAPITGLHHVTAIASDPQANLDFYTGLLGLRLVKRTVNFDDPSAYHLYYGDAAGYPGSIVTFFYWPDGAGRGRVGPGQPTRLSFSVPAASLDFWQNRFAARGLAATRTTRFGEDVLVLADPDGIPVDLVAVAADARTGWITAEVPAAHAIRGLHTIELTVRRAEPTETLLTRLMDHRLVRRDGDRARFESGAGGPGTYVDLIAAPAAPAGLGGVGTIHHIAFRVADDAAELALLERLDAAGLHTSGVRDRSYFRSIYYREPGGILFEIATDVPGFATDESAATLGAALKLPAQFEPHRAAITAALPALRLSA
jgi:glyoxalase family protein